MNRLFRTLVLAVLLSAVSVSQVRAAYVLPYPSYMPGNKLYRISRIADTLKGYWYFGNVAQVKYRLGLADKYLVEAKTLFEYGQYLLASDALARSDRQLAAVPVSLRAARGEGKDVRVLSDTVRSAMQKHLEILDGLRKALPSDVVWSPEKAAASQLPVAGMLDTSEQVRKRVASELP
jgi:hypothetical protein